MSPKIFEWIWIGLFVVIVVLRKIHERRSGNRTSLKGTPVTEAILMMAWGLFVGVAPFFVIFSSRLDFANIPGLTSPIVGAIGVLFFTVGIWMLHRSHADLGKLWSADVKPSDKHQLVVEGVYKRVRHPMYTAHVAWGIAQILLIPNWIAGVLPFILILLAIRVRIPREEKALIEEFGGEYETYVTTTGRIFPRFTKGS